MGLKAGAASCCPVEAHQVCLLLPKFRLATAWPAPVCTLPSLQGPLFKLMACRGVEAPHADYEALTQAHCCCLAGACLAVGIRFAGSANARAEALLSRYARHFLAAKQRAPEPGVGEQGRGAGGLTAREGQGDSCHLRGLVARLCCEVRGRHSTVWGWKGLT